MSTLNFQRALAIGFIVWAAAVVSGCASSVPILSDLVGSKPDMTAQVGAENVKQAVGVTNKTDTSSKQETTFKESAVGKVDTSNKEICNDLQHSRQPDYGGQDRDPE